jgi:integrase
MPRKSRDASIESKTARSRLPLRHGAYFRLIEPGLHLGYRKLATGPGTWIVRRYAGKGRYTTDNLRTADGALVLADDHGEADGARVMTFAQAQRAARPQRRPAGSLTVGECLDDYVAYLAARSERSAAAARSKIEGLIRPELGNVKVSTLTSTRLRQWRDALAAAPPRTRRGDFRPAPSTEDGRRARKVSTNRTLTVLRAALNLAFREGKVESDLEWRRVKAFGGVESARARYLTVAEAQQLMNACDPNFRKLVRAALETGCRYQELARLQCHDFNVAAGTVAIRQSKSGKPRHVILTAEGAAFFREVCAGRGSDAIIFTRDDGAPWADSNQTQRMQVACKHARIAPPIGFHGLRHTWASLAVMAGVPLMVVAQQLGHRDTQMVQRHYAHLAASFVTDAIRAGAPRFEFKPDRKVATLSPRGTR